MLRFITQALGTKMDYLNQMKKLVIYYELPGPGNIFWNWLYVIETPFGLQIRVSYWLHRALTVKQRHMIETLWGPFCQLFCTHGAEMQKQLVCGKLIRKSIENLKYSPAFISEEPIQIWAVLKLIHMPVSHNKSEPVFRPTDRKIP